MNLPKLRRSFFNKYTGRMRINGQTLRYRVSGPFGVGYRISVEGKAGVGQLTVGRDYPGAEVVVPMGKYEMSDESVVDSAGRKIARLSDELLETESTDELL